jgi:hypothetical protein
VTGGADGETVYELTFQAAAALEVLAELAATPLFYHRLAAHDGGLAAPLRLLAATLSLHDPPLAPPPWAAAPGGGSAFGSGYVPDAAGCAPRPPFAAWLQQEWLDPPAQLGRRCSTRAARAGGRRRAGRRQRMRGS